MISEERIIELALIGQIEFLYMDISAFKAITSDTEVLLKDIHELYTKLNNIKQDRIHG